MPETLRNDYSKRGKRTGKQNSPFYPEPKGKFKPYEILLLCCLPCQVFKKLHTKKAGHLEMKETSHWQAQALKDSTDQRGLWTCRKNLLVKSLCKERSKMEGKQSRIFRGHWRGRENDYASSNGHYDPRWPAHCGSREQPLYFGMMGIPGSVLIPPPGFCDPSMQWLMKSIGASGQQCRAKQ